MRLNVLKLFMEDCRSFLDTVYMIASVGSM